MIIFYAKSCEGCSGNRSLDKMEQRCKENGIVFETRRTILWERYEQEAKEIMELHPELTLPFFYATESGATLKGTSLTPLDEIDKLIEKEQNATETI